MSDNTYYFTFGASHLFKNRYLIIQAPNRTVARAYMFDFFGGDWAFCYSLEEWTQQYIMSGLSGDMAELGVFKVEEDYYGMRYSYIRN